MIEEIIMLLCGMYLGKHYPQYIPLPKITKSHTDAILRYLESLQTPAPPLLQDEHVE